MGNRSPTEMAAVMKRVFEKCQEMRAAGQKEYAHGSENAFDNFERTAVLVGVPRETVLLTFLLKHIDGISAYVKGHKSQREDVRGRIYDAIVYLCLLHGMVDEGEKKESKKIFDRFVSLDEMSAQGTRKEDIRKAHSINAEPKIPPIPDDIA